MKVMFAVRVRFLVEPETNELVGPPVTYPSPCTLPVFRADLVLVDTVHLGSSK